MSHDNITTAQQKYANFNFYPKAGFLESLIGQIHVAFERFVLKIRFTIFLYKTGIFKNICLSIYARYRKDIFII